MNLKKTILLVNEDTSQLKEYAQFLSKQGLNIIVSSQFNLTNDIIKNKKPHILILFIQNNNELLDYNIYLKNTHKLIIINNTNYKFKETVSDTLLIENSLLDKEKLYKQCLNTKNFIHDINDFNILLVEDNKLNQLYFGEIITQLNINYKVCEGYSDAVKLIENNDFSLIISDVLLKDGNGIDLLKIVSKNFKKQKPFIIISGFSEKELVEKYGNFKCHTLLLKPLDNITLKTAIINCLNLNHNFREANTQYDFTQITRILKNDKFKIAQSLQDFNEKLCNAINLIDSDFKNKDLKLLNDSFHDILNLSQYFGADVLLELIMKYKVEKKINIKNKLLEKIKTELNLVYDFYKNIKYN